jgi:hypothetical protein
MVAAAFAVAAFAASSISVSPTEARPSIEKEVNRDVPNSQSNAHVPSRDVPRPATLPVASADSSLALSVDGLDHFDQRTADSGNQFSLEPPDQGLCASGERVIEAVNDVFATYSTAGAKTSPTVSLTEFYTGQPQIVRHADGTATYGQFLSDPKCYYDPSLQRFFMTILEIDQDPSSGALGTHSSELIAVSKSSTPSTAAGDWYHYAIDTSNAGGTAVDTAGGRQVGARTMPTHPGCPCFGDQPLIGADANGFYVTSNEFSIVGPEFNGAQVYAFDKAGLARGTLKMQYVAGQTFLPLAEGPSYSLQPATSPTAADWAAGSNGTEYLLSALDFDATLDNRIAVWALTNTASLTKATPAVQLSKVVLPSEVYGQPPDAVQKTGSTPLAGVIEQVYGSKNGQSSSTPQEELLAGNDDRMNQAVFAHGQLWGALNTVVKTDSGPSHVGSAYFVVTPSTSGNQVAGTLATQGYLAVNQENLLYPSIGVTSAGQAIYTATLAGPDYFPSAVYTTISSVGGPSNVRLAAAGLGPDDGFTGYPPFGGPTGRWGDYSAAVADASGNVWTADEYIGQTCTSATFLQDTTCGGTRTILANWGTRISKVSTAP